MGLERLEIKCDNFGPTLPLGERGNIDPVLNDTLCLLEERGVKIETGSH